VRQEDLEFKGYGAKPVSTCHLLTPKKTRKNERRIKIIFIVMPIGNVCLLST
jgi:hypothetical protein